MRDRANPENTSGATDAANLFELVGRQCGLAVRASHALTAYLESMSMSDNYLSEPQTRHGAAVKALAFVVDLFLRREILRHLSNAADRVLDASDALHESATRTAWGQTPNLRAIG
jgi:hypothetical protein